MLLSWVNYDLSGMCFWDTAEKRWNTGRKYRQLYTECSNNVVEEKFAILSSGKDQRKKLKKKIYMEWLLQEACTDFGSHVRPEVDKNGKTVIVVMAKNLCLSACSTSRCLKAWGYSGLLCLWWVKRGVEGGAAAAMAGILWLLVSWQPAQIHTAGCAARKGEVHPRLGWADVRWLWWHIDFSGFIAVVLLLLPPWSLL